MIAGLFSGFLFLAIVCALVAWAKPWKKAPEAPVTEPGVPVKAPEPK